VTKQFEAISSRASFDPEIRVPPTYLRIFRISEYMHFRIYAILWNICINGEVKQMSETLVVSSRGQITLPAALRKRLGIKNGDVVILEARGNEIVLKPGIVLEIQHYSDEQIAQWDAEDKLSDQERAQMLDRLTTSKK